MADMVGTLKRVAKAGWAYQYNRWNGKMVARLLREHEQAGMSLAPATKRQCEDYARDVLGGTKYAPWLCLYSVVRGRFEEGWIPDNFYGERVVREISGAYGDTADSRALNMRLFGAEEFPDVGAYVNGLFLDRAGRAIPPGREKAVLFAGCDRVAFKLDDSMQGVGIHFFDAGGFDPDRIRTLGNGVFQSYIEQHPFFDAFSETSVATTRLTTAVDDAGTATLRAGYLRLGRGADSHVQSASHVRIAIDRETGALADEGYMPNWLTVDRHPDTGVTFKDKVIPSYADCVRVAVENHAKLPHVRCIGWDLSVDTAGQVKIIEWNSGHNDIKFGEAVQGPCFRDLNWERFRPR